MRVFLEAWNGMVCFENYVLEYKEWDEEIKVDKVGEKGRVVVWRFCGFGFMEFYFVGDGSYRRIWN